MPSGVIGSVGIAKYNAVAAPVVAVNVDTSIVDMQLRNRARYPNPHVAAIAVVDIVATGDPLAGAPTGTTCAEAIDDALDTLPAGITITEHTAVSELYGTCIVSDTVA